MLLVKLSEMSFSFDCLSVKSSFSLSCKSCLSGLLQLRLKTAACMLEVLVGKKLLARGNFDGNGAVKPVCTCEKPKADVSICPCMIQSISSLRKYDECLEGQVSQLKLSGKVLFLERKQDAHIFGCKQISEAIITATTPQTLAQS